MTQYTQDSLPLRIDDETIPPVETKQLPSSPSLSFGARRARRQKRPLQDARTHGIPELKRCRVCDEVKRSVEFSRYKASRDGLYHRCKACSHADQRARYHGDSGFRESQLFAHKFRSYGVTREQFESMLAEQGGTCAICGGPPTGKNWNIDHDHTTGVVRGLLCNGCNTGIGGLKDDPDILEAAAAYLRKHKK